MSVSPQRCMLRTALSFAVLMATGAASYAQTCEPQRVAAKYPEYAGKIVRIAATPTYPPFSYADPKDLTRVTGLEAEIIESALDCAGLKYEYVKGPWSGLLPTLFSGATDVMIGNVAYRADRAERADFVLFMRNGQSVVVQKGNPKKIVDLGSLCGKAASASIGGTSALEVERQSNLCAEKGRPKVAIQPSVDQEAAFRQLSNGRIDFVMDGASSAAARLAAEKAPDFELAFTISTDIAAGPAVKEGNEPMLRVITDGMRVLEREGKLKALMTKYGLSTDLLIPVEPRR
jgi:polar amino acid transport system substrate-binding protein